MVGRQVLGGAVFPENARLAIAAVAVGLCAAAGIWLFKQAIIWTNKGGFGALQWLCPESPAWAAILIPAAGDWWWEPS